MTKEGESWEMKRGKVAFGWTPRRLQEQSRGSCNPEPTALSRDTAHKKRNGRKIMMDQIQMNRCHKLAEIQCCAPYNYTLKFN